MPSQATVTAPVGPGNSVSSLLLTGVTKVEVEPYPKSIIRIFHDKGVSEYGSQATTTFTMSPSSGNITIVISQ